MPPDDLQDPTPSYSSRKPALVTYEEVMKISGRLDLIAYDLKALSRVPETVASLERRLQTQEQSTPAWGVELIKKVHALEIAGVRAEQTSTTWKDALMWANTILLLIFGAVGIYFAAH